MNLPTDHVPAYERSRSSKVLPYRTSVLRDLWCVVRDISARFTPPFTAKRLFEALVVLIVLPLLLAILGFQSAYFAALEKHTWDWEHSRAIVNLPAGSAPVSQPFWHSYSAVIFGVFWGTLFFVIGMAPYYVLAILR